MTVTQFKALSSEILSQTEKLAEAYSSKFEGDPEGELRAWLHVAARREAMVSDVYGKAERSYRLPEPHVPAAQIAWEALTLIWQQEEVHTKFIEVRLKDGLLKDRALSADLMIWLGAMEGKFLASLTGRPGLRQIFSKLAVHAGLIFAPSMVPEFTLALAEMAPREFFLLCAALEATACQSYARMVVLAEVLAEKLARDAHRSLQIENLAREFRLKRLDEAFHEEAFYEMAGWVVDDQLDASLTVDDCALRLASLLPRGVKALGTSPSPYVLTDGGLGKLFHARGLYIVSEQTT